MFRSKRFLVVALVEIVWILLLLVSADLFLRLMPWAVSLLGLYVVAETFRQSGLEEKTIDAALERLEDLTARHRT